MLTITSDLVQFEQILCFSNIENTIPWRKVITIASFYTGYKTPGSIDLRLPHDISTLTCIR